MPRRSLPPRSRAYALAVAHKATVDATRKEWTWLGLDLQIEEVRRAGPCCERNTHASSDR